MDSAQKKKFVDRVEVGEFSRATKMLSEVQASPDY